MASASGPLQNALRPSRPIVLSVLADPWDGEVVAAKAVRQALGHAYARDGRERSTYRVAAWLRNADGGCRRQGLTGRRHAVAGSHGRASLGRRTGRPVVGRCEPLA